LLAVAGKDLILYPLEQPAAPRRLRSDGRNYGTVRFSRDGQTVKDRQFHAFGPIAFDQTHGTALMGSQDGRVYGWGLATRQLIALSPAHAEYVNTIAVSSAGLVAYAGFGGAVRLWNPRSGEERSLTAAHPTSNLVLGPDGASIVFGTADGAIEYWDTRGGQRLRAMRLP
jgi:WD40 repeat protein